VDPIRATQAAAVGPPRLIAAIRGAIETASIEPPGRTIGSAEATSVIAVQKTIPKATLPGAVPPSPMAGSGETARLVATNATAAADTSPAMYSFRALGIKPSRGSLLDEL
jgi:hypothetical protein